MRKYSFKGHRIDEGKLALHYWFGIMNRLGLLGKDDFFNAIAIYHTQAGHDFIWRCITHRYDKTTPKRSLTRRY